jgi:nucleoside-diphosphate-sugar epimerase
MKIFVTGGTGFLGSYFISAAVKNGHEVIALRRPHSKPKVQNSQLKKVNWIEGQLSGDYGIYLKQCDALVHFASAGVSPQPASWDLCFKVNLINSLKLCESAVDAGVDKLLIAGSYAEYGKSALRYEAIPSNAALEPIGPYACSKAASFIAIHGFAIEKKIKLCYLRVFSAYGEGQNKSNLWPSLYESANSGNDYPMTMGEQIRDFISVKEVADKFVDSLLFDKVKSGIPLVKNIGSGKPRTVLEFSQYWWKKWNAKGKLLTGAIPYRDYEIMRYVPMIDVKDDDKNR